MPEGLRAAASKGEARKASRGKSFIWSWERIIVGPAVPWAETGLVNPDHLRPGQRAFIGSLDCFHERLKHYQGCGDDLNVLLIQSTTYCTTTPSILVNPCGAVATHGSPFGMDGPMHV